MISGLYNVNQNVRAGNSRPWPATLAPTAQDAYGILLNVSARPGNGLTFQGGISTGTTRTDYCDIRAAVPEQTAGHRPPGATRRPVRILAYRPRLLHRAEGGRAGRRTFRSDQGASLRGQLAFNARSQPSLGRNLSATTRRT